MSASNCAVIVDNRLSNNELSQVVDKHMKFLPEWGVISFRPSHIKTPEDYNRYLTSETFWKPLQDLDRVLIFQHDTEILREGVGEFMEWDYVGAPWKADAPWGHPERKGGNGGLSLRCPKKALSLIRHRKYDPSLGNEDVYFTHHLEQVGANVAPYEVCKRFSCETVFEMGTFGYHAIDKHFDKTQVNLILNQYGSSINKTVHVDK